MRKYIPSPDCECQHLKEGEVLLSNGMISNGSSVRECGCHKAWRTFARQATAFEHAKVEINQNFLTRSLPAWFAAFNASDCNIALQGRSDDNSDMNLDVQRVLFELAKHCSFETTNINALCSIMNRTTFDSEAPFTGIDILVIKNCEVIEAFSKTDFGRFVSFIGSFNGKIIFMFDGELKDFSNYKYFKASPKTLQTFKYTDTFEEAKKSLWD